MIFKNQLLFLLMVILLQAPYALGMNAKAMAEAKPGGSIAPFGAKASQSVKNKFILSDIKSFYEDLRGELLKPNPIPATVKMWEHMIRYNPSEHNIPGIAALHEEYLHIWPLVDNFNKKITQSMSSFSKIGLCIVADVQQGLANPNKNIQEIDQLIEQGEAAAIAMQQIDRFIKPSFSDRLQEQREIIESLKKQQAASN